MSIACSTEATSTEAASPNGGTAKGVTSTRTLVILSCIQAYKYEKAKKFKVLINNIDSGVEYTLSSFVEDIELDGVADTLECRATRANPEGVQ